MQQIARVLHNGRELAQEDLDMLSQIFLVDQTAEVYDPLTVDPVKFLTFRYDQVPYLMAHLGEYVKLYLRIGLQYPMDYWQAWVEQTKGYWNGGYNFWTYTLKMGGVEFGVAQTPGDNLVAKFNVLAMSGKAVEAAGDINKPGGEAVCGLVPVCGEACDFPVLYQHRSACVDTGGLCHCQCSEKAGGRTADSAGSGADCRTLAGNTGVCGVPVCLSHDSDYAGDSGGHGF